jgi:hypothetical protein
MCRPFDCDQFEPVADARGEWGEVVCVVTDCGQANDRRTGAEARDCEPYAVHVDALNGGRPCSSGIGDSVLDRSDVRHDGAPVEGV